jgi:polyphenol oxidase
MTAIGQELLTFQFSQFRKQPIVHGLSGRNAGLPAEGDIAYSASAQAADVGQNRLTLFAELGLDLTTLTLGKQVHGNRVVPVLESDMGRGQPPAFDGFPDTDGLVTGAVGVTLGVIVGDCSPIVLYDPRKHVVGVVHAGWRGSVGLIAKKAIEIMRAGYGCMPRSILAGIGPSICPLCYEVGQEVIDAWMDAGLKYARHAVIKRDDRLYFDIWTANRLALLDAGLQRINIEDSAICTRCQFDKYFSRRAFVAGASPKGSQMMVVQLQPRG